MNKLIFVLETIWIIVLDILAFAGVIAITVYCVGAVWHYWRSFSWDDTTPDMLRRKRDSLLWPSDVFRKWKQ